jgi:hypothetical protein
VTALLLATAAWMVRDRLQKESAETGTWWWRAMVVFGVAAFGVVWGLNALAPDTTPPGMSPALEQAAANWAGLPLHPHAQVSAGAPLWGAAFAAGRHSACALLHVLCLLALTAVLYGSMRRWVGSVAASVTALLTVSNPGLGAVAAESGTEVLLLLTLAGGLAFAGLGAWSGQPRMFLPALLTLSHAALLIRDPQAEWFRGFLFGFLPGPWLMAPLLAACAGWLFHANQASAILIAVFACLTSWPRITRMLAPSTTKIAMSANPRLAIQRQGVGEFLSKHLRGYEEARFLDESTPPGSRILVEPPIAWAWTQRETVPFAYWRPLAFAAFDDEFLPDREERLPVERRPRKSWSVENQAWVAEVLFFREGNKVERQAGWRVRCPEAFDNNPMTACQGRLEARFPEDLIFDEVRLRGKRGEPAPLPRGRRAAVRMEWKRQGVTHLLAAKDSDWLDELQRHLPYWHVTELGERNGARLFRLE